jgi:hypothetical protein
MDRLMPPLPRVGELAVAEDSGFQRRSWRVQRVGWVLMALLVLAGLAGLLGSGPLSHAKAVHEDGVMAVEYQRFARWMAPTQIKVHFGPQAVRDGEVRIWLDRRYVEKTKIEPVVPQPQKVEVGPDRLTYVFAAQAAPGPGTVAFHLEFTTFGLVEGRAGVAGAEIGFRHLVYP